MKRVLISVEGQTEEYFVKDVLSQYFEEFKIYITPIVVSTKKEKNGTKFKGGISNYEKVKNEIFRLLKDSSASLVTTMYDLYGLPKDFPGKNSYKQNNDCYDKVNYYENEFKKDINNNKFLPFLMVHEFETLLFTSPEIMAQKLLDKKMTCKLEKIVKEYKNVEKINDGPETHPSKRIEKLFPRYQKTKDGLIITKEIGIENIIASCTHFSEWIKKIKTSCSN